MSTDAYVAEGMKAGASADRVEVVVVFFWFSGAVIVMVGCF